MLCLKINRLARFIANIYAKAQHEGAVHQDDGRARPDFYSLPRHGEVSWALNYLEPPIEAQVMWWLF